MCQRSCVPPLFSGSEHITPSLWYAEQGEKKAADWDDNSKDMCETASAAYQKAHIRGNAENAFWWLHLPKAGNVKCWNLEQLHSRLRTSSLHHLHPGNIAALDMVLYSARKPPSLLHCWDLNTTQIWWGQWSFFRLASLSFYTSLPCRIILLLQRFTCIIFTLGIIPLGFLACNQSNSPTKYLGERLQWHNTFLSPAS